MIRFNKLLPAMLSTVLVSACSSIPSPDERASLQDLRDTAVSGWETTPAVTYRTHRQATELLEPQVLPSSVYEMKVGLELASWVTAEELARIVEIAGIPVMLATDKLAETRVFVPRYNGSIGTLLDSLSISSDLSFSWHRGILIIDQSSPYLLRIPQNEDIAKVIGEAIGSMGAEEVQTSKEAGIVSYRASTKDQRKIETYLDRLAVNTSMINLQVAVMNVSLDEQRRKGLDWSSLSVQAGELGLLETASGAVEEGAKALTGAAAKVSGSGASLIMESSTLSLQGVLNMLSTYGESRTVQNLTLKTLSGVAVELRSGESIPYVDDVSLNVSDNSSTSGANTTTVETGFDISIVPFYDAEDNLVTVELDLEMKSLVGFKELSAGEQLGTLSRPQIQDQAIKNIARMEAGETALIGGLVYESVSDNRTGLAGFEHLAIGSKSTRNSYNALFILMRPTVVVYGPRSEKNEVPSQ